MSLVTPTFSRTVAAFSLSLALLPAAIAQGGAAAAETKPAEAKAAAPPATPAPGASQAPANKPVPEPMPADAHAEQSAVIGGKTVKYTVTISTIPVKDSDGKVAGEVVVTAYTVPGESRPVTFALNGGPGASSVYLNFGAIGPKRVQFGEEGDSPSDPATLRDNPGSWLDFTDLVFIDPVGTGFSRSVVPEDKAKKLFYNPSADTQYLSRVIYDWLVRSGRLTARKYLIGESYGGFRGPRITHYLASDLGVALNGVVLVSPYLNPAAEGNQNISPLPWMLTLPSITAAHLERQHKLTPEAMAGVIAYTEGEYATDLIHGQSDPAATPRIVEKVTAMTGLDPQFVKQAGGRLETGAYLREAHRAEGKLASVYDSNVTSYDPYPFSPDQMLGDPILESIIAPLTSAMVDFMTRTVGWKIDERYNALSWDVGRQWDRNLDEQRGSVTDLRQAVAADPKLRVLIVHGWNDLSCPFMGSVLTVNQIPVMGDPTRVAVHEYPGGHMFYTRPDSQASLKNDAREMYSRH